MKGTLNTAKNQIVLEDGNVHLAYKDEAAGDFIARIKGIVKNGGNKLTLTKEAVDGEQVEEPTVEKQELSDLEKFRRDLLAAAEANKPKIAKEKLPPMSEEQRKAFAANELSLKEIHNQQKIALAEKKAEEAEKKRLAKEETKRKAEEARLAKLAEGKAERQAEVDIMVEEANKAAENMLAEGTEALQAKVQGFLNGMVERATAYLETGKLPGKGRKASTTSSGEGTDPNPEEVAHIRSLIGASVSFERSGETLSGEVQGVGIDRRQGLAMFKLKVDGKTYYKSYNKIDDLTFED